MAIQLKSLSPGISTNPISIFVGVSFTFTAEIYEDTLGLFDGETTRFGRPITGIQWQVSPNYDPVTDVGNWQDIPGATDLQDLGGIYNDGTNNFRLWISEYTVGPVNPSNDGNYYRIVIISDTNVNVDAIGDASVPDPGSVVNTDIVSTIDDPLDEGFRQLEVNANPEIVVIQENYGDPIKIVSALGDTSGDPAITAASYANRTISSASDLDNLYITWYYSFDYDPINDFFGGTWTAINDESGPGTYSDLSSDVGISTTDAIITETVEFSSQLNGYLKRSNLVISQAGFDFNAAYFRAEFTSTGVLQSPVITYNYFQLLINPEIFILQNPGDAATDTISPAYCYASGNPSNGVNIGNQGGDIRVSVNAITTAGGLSTLSYEWEVRAYTDYTIFGEGEEVVTQNLFDIPDFISVNELNGFHGVVISDDNELILYNMVYIDVYEFRCIISGTSSEPSVTSNSYKIYMRDNLYGIFDEQTESVTGDYPEDYYGNVPDRLLLTDKPVRQIFYSAGLNTNFYTGQAGNNLLEFEVSQDGGLNYTKIPGAELQSRYVDLPFLTDVDDIDISFVTYDTDYLRIEFNQGDIYRVKSTSTSYWDTVGWNPGDPKVLLPSYTTFSPLSLKKELFIINNPSTIRTFLGDTLSFSADVDVTSDPLSISRQWQWAILNAEGNPGTFTNLSTGEFFATTGETGPTGSGQNTVSGVTSSVLQITNSTEEISNYAFRLLGTAPDSIGSVTTSYAKIIFIVDNFIELTSINDLTVPEFSSISFTVIADTVSGGTISYQWQKSVDGTTFFDLSDGATGSGSTIFGSTTQSLTITGVTDPEDIGFYRLRLISPGGITEFSNIAQVSIDNIEIVILEQFDTSNLSYIEEEIPFPPFSILAASTNGQVVSYQWQLRRPGSVDDSWQNFPIGYQFQLSSDRIFTPEPFLTTGNPDTTDDDMEVRCRLSIPALGTNYTFSDVGILQVIRQLTYNLGSVNRIIEQDTSFTITLNPIFTGSATPTYTWQYSTNGTTWQNTNNLSPAPTNGLPTVFFSSVPSSWNGYYFRCRIDMSLLEQLNYVLNGVPQSETVSSIGTGFTYPIQIQVVDEESIPAYYTNEISKTGCPVGTVICVPKPPDFVDNKSPTSGDDIGRWGIASPGSTWANGLSASTALFNLDYTRFTANEESQSRATRQSVQNQNIEFLQRANFGGPWILDPSNVKTPNWIIDRYENRGDRFPGFIPLRGQWLYVDEFPLLYRIIGDTYGTYTNSSGKRFKLPNPYGKRLMGTGAVDSRKGTVTLIPEYSADGQSGGSTNEPGTVGGRYIYERSAQLPPGSPGRPGEEDGTAGTLNPETFILGNYKTDGWEDLTSISQPRFSGNFTYSVGPIDKIDIPAPPSHNHRAVGIGKFIADSHKSSAKCSRFDTLPNDKNYFNEILNGNGRDIGDGPAYIPSSQRGKLHTHGIDDVGRLCGDDYKENQKSGVGDVEVDSTFVSEVINISANRGGSTRQSLNAFPDFVDFSISQASRINFDANLSFYLRNSEPIPITSDYFRLKWMIKAY